MKFIDLPIAVAGFIAIFWAGYLMLLPIMAKLRRAPLSATEITNEGEWPSVAVIIPAHNMEQVIERCVHFLKASHYPMDRVGIHVIADHCCDETDKRARAAGAATLIRSSGPRGKTYTLGWALDALTKLGSDPDLYVIVDATVRVEPDFLAALAARSLQREDIIVGHAIVDPDNSQWFAQCVGLSLAHRNLQNWARDCLGLSALIEGRGMAYSRHYISQFAWTLAMPNSARPGSHPTEDWRHGVRVVQQGYRVAYADNARLFTPLRETLGAATQQGIRWERGRMANAITFGIQLLGLGIRQRNRMQIFSGLDAIQPPVAILGTLSVGLAALSVAASETQLAVILGIAPIVLIGLYGFAVLQQGRRDGIKAKSVLWAPVYLVWRSISFVLALGSINQNPSTDKTGKNAN